MVRKDMVVTTVEAVATMVAQTLLQSLLMEQHHIQQLKIKQQHLLQLPLMLMVIR